jgi:hypothetical protein
MSHSASLRETESRTTRSGESSAFVGQAQSQTLLRQPMSSMGRRRGFLAQFLALSPKTPQSKGLKAQSLCCRGGFGRYRADLTRSLLRHLCRTSWLLSAGQVTSSLSQVHDTQRQEPLSHARTPLQQASAVIFAPAPS